MKIINMSGIKKYFGLASLIGSAGCVNAVFISTLLMATPVHAIKKCQDADGKWHYGDVAVRACENSKVTTLSSKGFVKAEKKAPKSEEQLEAEKAGLAELEAERKKQEELEKEKSRVLAVYESEDDIDRQRESRLVSIDNNIAVHNTYIDSLKRHIAFDKKKLDSTKNAGVREQIYAKIEENEKNIKEYSKEIDGLKLKRIDVIKMFDNEKVIYKELTNSN